MFNSLPKCLRDECTNLVKIKTRKYCSCSCAQKEKIKKYKDSKQFRSKLREVQIKKKIKNGYINSPITRKKLSDSLKGHSTTDETKQKISTTLKENAAKFWLGKHLSKESCAKISTTLKQGFEEGRIVSTRKGIKLTEEVIKKRSDTYKKNAENGKYHKHHRSKPEILFGKRIEEIFNVKMKGNFYLQGYYYDYKFGIFLFELDGSYWHSLPSSQTRDIIKDNIAIDNKYILIRFCLDREKDVDKLIEDNFNALFIIFSEHYVVLKNNEIRGVEDISTGCQSISFLNCKYSISNLDKKEAA